MKSRLHTFWRRNARAGDLLELFFIASVVTVLITRFYLYVTDYPEIGGRTLHIAHMLPGGLLMLAAIVILFGVLGHRAQVVASVLGGVGFGLFIDELGKFITQDNNYFFQPTIAIIYSFFIGLFFLTRLLSRQHLLTAEEHLLNALAMLEEVVLYDLDTTERAKVLYHLRQADQSHPLVAPLLATVQGMSTEPPARPHLLTRIRMVVGNGYHRFIVATWGLKFFVAAVAAKTSWEVVTIGLAGADWLLRDQPEAPPVIVSLEMLSALVVTIMVVRGIMLLQANRMAGYNLLIKATLVDIFFTQFFAFYRESLEALPLLVFNLIIYITLRLLIAEERRLQLGSHQTSVSDERPPSSS